MTTHEAKVFRQTQQDIANAAWQQESKIYIGKRVSFTGPNSKDQLIGRVVMTTYRIQPNGVDGKYLGIDVDGLDHLLYAQLHEVAFDPTQS